MRGVVAPGRFIAVAEECGLIVPLGEHILQCACAQMQAWLQSGMPMQRIAVNLSARQLRDTDFVAGVQRILESTGLAARRLEFELTGSELVQQDEEAISVFNAASDGHHHLNR